LRNLIVGVFSPALNLSGGAEWVALNIIFALKEQGHEVILLCDNPIDQKKFTHVFGRQVQVDKQFILPLRFFSQVDPHNVYTDAIRTLILKTKCNITVDTYSNALLFGTDIAYIHYPLLKGVAHGLPQLRNRAFFMPYQALLKRNRSNRLILANSQYTAKAILEELGINPYVLYPSVSNKITALSKGNLDKPRQNIVVTISRISEEKNLQAIPQIAEKVREEISFIIAGIPTSTQALVQLKNLIKRLHLSDRVKVLTYLPREQMAQMLLNSRAYLHTMKDEHFGISIVEAMSLGCVPVVHDSGGPREFVPDEFRFKTIDEAAALVEKAVDMWSPSHAFKFSNLAEQFSENNFSKRFIRLFDYYLENK
jgi:glycosyltransferase involved in cell wall biosynthesis